MNFTLGGKGGGGKFPTPFPETGLWFGGTEGAIPAGEIHKALFSLRCTIFKLYFYFYFHPFFLRRQPEKKKTTNFPSVAASGGVTVNFFFFFFFFRAGTNYPGAAPRSSPSPTISLARLARLRRTSSLSPRKVAGDESREEQAKASKGMEAVH